jgi:acyl carrier protein
MVPSSYLILDEMPLTPNKKIDRKALPAPDQSRAELETAYVAPRNAMETSLVEITASLLNVERVGVYDNFFDLGGHSLLATQFVSRIRDTFDVDVALRALFEKPNVAEMALEIERLKIAGEQPQAPKIKAIARESVRVKRSDMQQPDEVKK